MSAITLAGVTRTFAGRGEDHEVLRGVDLQVESGAYVAIMGRSGSGKSTLLNIIGALLQPTAGSVQVDGTELAGLGQEKAAAFRASTVGFVFQAFHLLPRLKVWENVAVPLVLGGLRPGRQAEQRARAELKRLGLAEVADARPGTLSGGQQQRVAIARALITRPPLLLADEPTGNLDGDSREDVLTAFDAIRRDVDATLLVVTHDPLVAQHAGYQMEMAEGRLLR